MISQLGEFDIGAAARAFDGGQEAHPHAVGHDGPYVCKAASWAVAVQSGAGCRCRDTWALSMSMELTRVKARGRGTTGHGSAG